MFCVECGNLQVDISDGGASDGSIPSKKKKRRVLFSKVLKENEMNASKTF